MGELNLQGSPVDLTSNTLAIGVDSSGGESSAQQNCAFRSPSHCNEIGDLGRATAGQGDAPPTLPVSVNDGDRTSAIAPMRARLYSSE